MPLRFEPLRSTNTIIGGGPTLFRQISTRLAIFTLLFALLDVGIVVATYSNQPQSLAEELLTLEAKKAAKTQIANASQIIGPPGASHWSAQFVDAAGLQYEPGKNLVLARHQGRLIEWTQREKTAAGYRIAGVRSIFIDGQPRWLLMQFEANGLRPYLPVIGNEIIEHVALPLIPLSLLMLLFNILAVRRVLDPLRRAEQQVDGLDPANMSLRISEPSEPREVATLVRAVNRALQRLDEAMEILRAFTANAAHELRTPLSIMQLSLDQLPEGKQRDALLSDNRQMTRLVSQMLDLAQADTEAFQTDAVVDLAAIGRQAVSHLAPIAFDANRDLIFEDRGAALIKGHPEAIFRIYRNLIDNALIHAPGETPIEVVAGPGAQLSVRDFGPGIPSQDLENLFDRFWRKDRSSGNGTGLGLGIVKRLVEAHNGQIYVESADGAGACFVVKFPSGAAQ